MKLQIKQLKSGINTPKYATDDSAGFDLEAANTENITIKPGQTSLIPTGLAIALPKGYEAQVRPRSGLAYKNSITVLNTPGTIDADYRGEVGVILINHGKEDFIISKGMRIAQMIINKYEKAEIQIVANLDETQRGEGGFGSTGTAAAS
ncbi:MAG: dUTP diphosphatase [Rickettsiales bacterium]|jgi:dUTP pyrophosphatase|nr:dUTP diphosphatase [Rickettsiales bacterium]